MLSWITTNLIPYLDVFLPAAGITLGITLLGILVGLILGFLAAMMRLSKFRLLNGIAYAYIWVIRGTPLLLQLLLVYFGMAKIVNISAFPAAFIALGVHNGAYIAEIFRGAIESIGKGQREAGISLGMKRFQMLKRIVFPQALKQALPALGNQFIIALKDSSLASSIAVPELLLRSRQLGSGTFKTLEMLSIAALFYLLMTSILTLLSQKLENKMSYGKE
ncbi:MAG TPA: amino acid ABC transporter permease [Clostridiaceae bacterium]|nr:amino acid ABC transporter permease [Clostridiaceae bacterium]